MIENLRAASGSSADPSTVCSAEIVSGEEWLSRSHSYGRKTGRKGSGMPNDNRIGLKISGSRSYEFKFESCFQIIVNMCSNM